jgi:ribosome-associated protein
MRTENYTLTSEYIELYALLKLVVPLGSGGEAKQIIRDEYVSVDGVVETRKKCKIRAGQSVRFEDLEINVLVSETNLD